MGIVAKQSVWNSVILFTGAFLGAVNTVLLFPKMLTQAEIGLAAMLMNVAVIAAQLGSFGMPTVLVRFVPKFRKNKGENGGLLRLVSVLSLLGGGVVSILLYFGKDYVLLPYENGADLFSKYYLLVIPLLLFTLLTFVLNSYYKSILKTVFQSFIQEVFIRLAKTFVLIIYFFDWINFDVFILLFVLIYGLSVLILVINLIIMGEFNLSSTRANNVTDKKSTFYTYGIANFFTGFAYNISNRIDILMIGAMIVVAGNSDAGLQASGIYVIASFMCAIIEMPGRALANIATPIIAKSWIENDLQAISLMYKKSSINQFLFGGLVFILIWSNIDSIIILFNNITTKGEDYSLIKYIVLFLGIGKLFHTLSGINGNIIVTSKYYWVGTIFMIILLLVTVVTNLIFIPTYGVMGAAIATASSLLIFNVLSFAFLLTKFKLQPFTLKTILMLIIGGTIMFLATLLPAMENPIFDIILTSVVIASLYFPAVYIFRISEDVNILIKKALSFVKL